MTGWPAGWHEVGVADIGRRLAVHMRMLLLLLPLLQQEPLLFGLDSVGLLEDAYVFGPHLWW